MSGIKINLFLLLTFLVTLTSISISADRSFLSSVKTQRGGISRILNKGRPKSLTPSEFEIISRFRLPNDTVEPISYDIEIIPILNVAPSQDWEPWTAPGKVTILIHTLKDTDQIVICMRENVVNLVADNPITLTKKSDGTQIEIELSATGHDPVTGLYVIRLKSFLLRGEQYDLHMEYVAQITPTKIGLYRAPYTDAMGQERWIATTQMETIGFRFMVPSFDEPMYKAIFTIRIGRPRDFISLSNSAQDKTGVEDPNLPPGYVWDEYLPTVKMSTYLIALTVAEYSYEQADETIFPGKPVKVYGPKDLIARGGGILAAEISAKVLAYYEQIFNVPYAMHKMDSLAVPRDYFEFGAMENWGLNIYRDNALLYYDGESFEMERHRVISVLAHELAHQWFGNHVTCLFWDQMWLNEGFASYIAYWGMDEVANVYNSLDEIVYSSLASAQAFDASPFSHPVINGGTPEEYEGLEAFDTITYGKGASLLRMMEGFLTKDTLHQGLGIYLVEKEFDNAHQDDFFAVINDKAHADGTLPADMDVKTIMDTYTLQKGFPLVRVSRASPDTAYISQERYTESKLKNRELDPNELWEVPVSIMTAENPNADPRPAFWLHKDTILAPYSVDTSQWLIVNPGAYGYYRVLYDTPLTHLIHEQLKADHTVIDPLTKVKLIDDHFQFAQNGYASIETALGMTTFLGLNTTTRDLYSWLTALDYLADLQIMLSGTTALPHFQAYLVNKAGQTLDVIGWDEPENEHGATTIVRPSLLEAACSWGNEMCNQRAVDALAHWRENDANGDDTNPIPLNTRVGTYCPGVANGPQENFNFILQKYKTEPLAAQQALLVDALTCTQSLENLLWLLANSMDPMEIRREHLLNVIQNTAQNLAGRTLTVNFVRENWAKLAELSPSYITNSVSSFTSFQTTQEDYDNLVTLMADIEEKDPALFEMVKNSLESSLNKIQMNIEWSAENLENVSMWLSTHSK